MRVYRSREGKEDIWVVYGDWVVAMNVVPSNACEVYADDPLLRFLYTLYGIEFNDGV